MIWINQPLTLQGFCYTAELPIKIIFSYRRTNINNPKGGCMSDTSSDEKKSELKIFIFLTVFLAPLLSVLIVGGYGFLVWMSQILIGPPGPG